MLTLEEESCLCTFGDIKTGILEKTVQSIKKDQSKLFKEFPKHFNDYLINKILIFKVNLVTYLRVYNNAGIKIPLDYKRKNKCKNLCLSPFKQ